VDIATKIIQPLCGYAMPPRGFYIQKRNLKMKKESIAMDDNRIMVIAFPNNGEESKRKMEAIKRIINDGSASVLSVDLDEEPDEEDENITFRFAGSED